MATVKTVQARPEDAHISLRCEHRWLAAERAGGWTLPRRLCKRDSAGPPVIVVK